MDYTVISVNWSVNTAAASVRLASEDDTLVALASAKASVSDGFASVSALS
jgi:ribonuclease PH